jgi:hypothetical protein
LGQISLIFSFYGPTARLCDDFFGFSFLWSQSAGTGEPSGMSRPGFHPSDPSGSPLTAAAMRI